MAFRDDRKDNQKNNPKLIQLKVIGPMTFLVHDGEAGHQRLEMHCIWSFEMNANHFEAAFNWYSLL